MRIARLAVVLSTVVLLAGSRPLVAQPAPGADPKEMARNAGEEGLDLYRRGKFDAAYERFAVAEQIAHSPVFVLWMARSKRGTHELLAAKRLFERVAGEALAPSASPKWIAARDEAKAELTALAAKIPSVTLRAPGAPPDTTLELDGKVVEPDRAIEVDPGPHTARATAPGHAALSKSVTLDEGPTTIELRLDKATAPSGSLVPGAVVLGAGLLGVAGGAVTGAYALVLAGEVEDNCIGTQCLAADEQKAADADTLARASTGLFIAGGVVAATGVVLLVLRPRIGDAAAFQLAPTRAELILRF